MSKLLSGLVGVMLASAVSISDAAEKLSADEIMQRNDARYTGDTQKFQSVLTLIDKKGRERVKHLKSFGVDKADVEKSLIVFELPADVKGTSYLAFDWENKGKEDDSWLYLPALQKVKRVAASDESGAFMGSDFSYADINGLDVDDFHHSIEKDSEIVDGQDCWVIKGMPKSEKVIDETGYTEIKSWVRKDNYIVVKSIINVKKGKKVKYFAARDIEEIQGVWTAKTLQMVTTKKGKKQHASVLKFSNIQYNENVDEAMFDKQAMQRGI